MADVQIDKEIRERVQALSKRRESSFADTLAWCVNVGVKRQDTLDRFADKKRKEAKSGKKKSKKPAKAKTAKKSAPKKPTKAKKPAKAKTPKAGRAKKSSPVVEETKAAAE